MTTLQSLVKTADEQLLKTFLEHIVAKTQSESSQPAHIIFDTQGRIKMGQLDKSSSAAVKSFIRAIGRQIGRDITVVEQQGQMQQQPIELTIPLEDASLMVDCVKNAKSYFIPKVSQSETPKLEKTSEIHEGIIRVKGVSSPHIKDYKNVFAELWKSELAKLLPEKETSRVSSIIDTQLMPPTQSKTVQLCG